MIDQQMQDDLLSPPHADEKDELRDSFNDDLEQGYMEKELRDFK